MNPNLNQSPLNQLTQEVEELRQELKCYQAFSEARNDVMSSRLRLIETNEAGLTVAAVINFVISVMSLGIAIISVYS